MRTIYKYPLAITDSQAVLMPVGAEIISAQVQGADLCIWAAVDPTAKKHARVIHIYGTGHPIPDPDKLHFIGTVQQMGGALVWHVFAQRP